MAIQSHLHLNERLVALRTCDSYRQWRSLDDERFCILCEKTFKGRQVRITRDRRGQFQVHCPGENCKGGPGEWVHPGNPLTSETAYQDWWRALGSFDEQESAGATMLNRGGTYA